LQKSEDRLQVFYTFCVLCVSVVNKKTHHRDTEGTENQFDWEEMVMKVHWRTDADAALAEAKESDKPVLIDFSASPA